MISDMVSSGEKNKKYFIGFKDHDCKIKPLRIMLPKMSISIRNYKYKYKEFFRLEIWGFFG